MSIIKTENLTFAYPSSYDNIFENVSFIIDTDWKLGFIGRNGRGKTTFLKLLKGEYEYSGKIISSVIFDYFPYPVADKKLMTLDILLNIAPAAEEWEFMRELSYLDVDAEVLWRSFDTLSNGEQTKVLLAALFLNEGHFLLIDEPTNHLDIKARAVVAEYLKKKKGFILVSHDRNVLDTCIDHILVINRTNIEVQKGNYSCWEENFNRQQMFEETQNEHLKKDIKRLQTAAAQTKTWSDKTEKGKYDTKNAGLRPDRGFVGHKSAKMMKRSKALELRRESAVTQKSELLRNTESADDLKISALSHHSSVIASFINVVPFYDDTAVCTPVSFDIKQGERVILDGKNGSGKSSLLKILAGERIKYTGTISVASGLIISYVPQDTSFLHGTLTEYAVSRNIDETLFKTLLRKMDFERIQFEKDMSDFSGGQKKKVLIAGSLCEKAHLYIWDEPLNFIDIYSRKQIENLILDCSPTMLIVEHDKAFRNSIGTKTVNVDKI